MEALDIVIVKQALVMVYHLFMWGKNPYFDIEQNTNLRMIKICQV